MIESARYDLFLLKCINTFSKNPLLYREEVTTNAYWKRSACDAFTQLKNCLPFEELRGFSSSECHFSGLNWFESLTPGLRWHFKSVPGNEYGATWDKSSQFYIVPALLCSPLDRLVICSCYLCFFSFVPKMCDIKVPVSLPLVIGGILILAISSKDCVTQHTNWSEPPVKSCTFLLFFVFGGSVLGGIVDRILPVKSHEFKPSLWSCLTHSSLRGCSGSGEVTLQSRIGPWVHGQVHLASAVQA